VAQAIRTPAYKPFGYILKQTGSKKKKKKKEPNRLMWIYMGQSPNYISEKKSYLLCLKVWVFKEQLQEYL
jgi:predicted nucleic acid-binding Zn finger protein